MLSSSPSRHRSEALRPALLSEPSQPLAVSLARPNNSQVREASLGNNLRPMLREACSVALLLLRKSLKGPRTLHTRSRSSRRRMLRTTNLLLPTSP
jgi:hypothetical protein